MKYNNNPEVVALTAMIQKGDKANYKTPKISKAKKMLNVM